MEEVGVTPPEQIGCFQRSEFTVKEIFTDNHNWDRYYYVHRREVRSVERAEVEKMLSCKGAERGCFVYYCPTCEEFRTISFGCNSRLCSECGKQYTDQWAKRLGKAMFDVPHRHAVLTPPDRLRGVLKEDQDLWKVIMDSAIKALHVPERQFKMIWYYGAYSRKRKSRYKRYLSHSRIRQCKLDELMAKKRPRCPNCGTQMEFVMFFKKDPPLPSETREFGMKLNDWNYLWLAEAS